MNQFKRRVILSSFSAIVCISAGCGSGGGDEAAPSTLPMDEVTTTTAEVPTTVATSETTAAEMPEIDAEMFEGMLATENGRALVASGIAAETGLELDAAECLLDAIPVEMLVEAAGSFLGGSAEGGLFPAEQMADISPLLDSCGIAAESLMP